MPWENNRPNHVPKRIREQCLQRDGHQCTATTRDGHRCPETTRLEAAHIRPWQPGETTHPDNIRTLCHWHHNRETQAQAQEARKRAGIATEKRPKETHPGLTP